MSILLSSKQCLGRAAELSLETSSRDLARLPFAAKVMRESELELWQFLQANGYTSVRVFRASRAPVVCAVKAFAYTTAIVVDLDLSGYERRYCFEHWNEAADALAAWDGVNHPPGPWIKCKGAGVDLLHPAIR